MEKNNFLILNDLIYHIYASKTIDELKKNFMLKLKMLIPHSYSSLLLAEQGDDGHIRLSSPVCIPDSFTEAEQLYIEHADQDDLYWILHTSESTLVKESDLLDDSHRLNTPVYRACYQKFRVYDTLQYSIVFQQKILGVFTLFRTRMDGVFSDEEVFFLHALGLHLNASLFHILSDQSASDTKKADPSQLQKKFQLTAREAELLELILAYKNNDEICQILGIRENTVQKHMQNIFRKTGVSSKWDLLRLQADS